MTVTIYHNPNCGTSRNVLAMIRQSGEDPVVIVFGGDAPPYAGCNYRCATGAKILTYAPSKAAPFSSHHWLV
jgi:hypothetical protein